MFTNFSRLPYPLSSTDRIIFLVISFLSGVLAIPYSMIKKIGIRRSIVIIFAQLMPKDFLIDFLGVKFIARKGKTDILILNEISEPWMKNIFKPNRDDVVVDVGSHVGKYSLVASKLVGNSGKVIAIEAEPENYKALLRNISINSFTNITPLNLAAFNKNSKINLYIDELDNQNSLKANIKRGRSVEVEARTIDSIANEYNISKIDFLKIDVEGAEVEVLEGMEHILRNSPDLKVLIETSEKNKPFVDNFLNKFHRHECKILSLGYYLYSPKKTL